MTSSGSFVRPFLPDLPSNQISFLTSKPVSTPSLPGSSQSFSIIARTQIHAPASIVAGITLLPSEWRKWNSYIPRCDVVRNPDDDDSTAFYSSYLFGPANDGGKGQRMLSVGDEMKFYCNMDDIPFSELNDSVIKELATSIDVVKHIGPLDPAREDGRMGWRIAWITTTTMGGLLRAERVTEIVETDDGECEYVAYESFGGFLGMMPWMLRKMMAEKLVRGFGVWAKDLKLRAEGVVEGGDGAGESSLKKNEHGNWTLMASEKKDMPTA